MTYDIDFTDQAKKQIASLKKSEIAAYNKLSRLLIELAEHPYTGTGNPEKMQYDFRGCYSRRITRKHRLIYSVNDKEITVEVVQVLGHYNDK